MPGGSTRSAAYYVPFPLAMKRGAGYRIWDVDGNEFIDFLNNFASLIHGHCHPKIIDAVSKQISEGFVFPAPSAQQGDLAERICSRIQSIDSVRFTNSGTEAVMMAIRAARAFTGRDHIVMASKGFHGTWDQVSLGLLNSGPGIPQAVKELAHFVDYNDTQSLESVMASHGAKIAAIIFEPVMVAGGVVTGQQAFLTTARRLADHYGALLILDEVVTMRLALGGYQAVLNVRPDLTVLGKIIGGGFPVGAIGGKREIMDLFHPQRADRIAHSGTFNGNLITMVAGCASLDLLTAGEIARINALGARLAANLRATLVDLEISGSINDCGSLIQLVLPTQLLARLHLAALEEGIFFGARGYLNISTVMSEEVIDEAGRRLANAFGRALEAGVAG